MNFLDVEYLSNLEKETISNMDYILGSIGGGSTLFIIALISFAISLLLYLKDVNEFVYFVENKIDKIKRHKLSKKELKSFVKTYNSKKKDKTTSWNIESNETYKKLSFEYKVSKVSIVFRILVLCIFPFYLILKTIDEVEKFFRFDFYAIFSLAGIALLASSLFVGMINTDKELKVLNYISYENFQAEGKGIKYPVLYKKQKDNNFEIYFLSDNTIKKINYDGKISIDKDLEIDNEVLEKQIIVLDDNINNDFEITDFSEIIGYITITSYSGSKKEYEQFKKDNKEFMEKSIFTRYLDEIILNGIDKNPIQEVVLKTK